MRIKERAGLVALTLLAAFLTFGGQVAAGTIDIPLPTRDGVVVGKGLGDVRFPEGLPRTFNPNNDENERFENPFTIRSSFAQLDLIDIVFSVKNSAGTTEYLVTYDVTNRTRVNWFDFHFELGFFTGDLFVRSNDFDFLDFDVGTTELKEDPTKERTPTPGSNRFAQLDHRANTLDWSGAGPLRAGVVPPNGTAQFGFALDLPDFSASMPETVERRDGEGRRIGYQFTLRAVPTGKVPAPPTLALVTAALACVFVMRVGAGRRAWISACCPERGSRLSAGNMRSGCRPPVFWHLLCRHVCS